MHHLLTASILVPNKPEDRLYSQLLRLILYALKTNLFYAQLKSYYQSPFMRNFRIHEMEGYDL